MAVNSPPPHVTLHRMGVVNEPPVTPEPTDSPRRVAGLKLLIAGRQATQLFDQRAKHAGLSRATWSLVAAVARNPGTTQRKIAAMLEVTEVTAGRLIDRLCASRYLERRENPADRRGYCVYLTAAAQPILELLGKVATIQEDDVFRGIDAEELALLDDLLTKILKNIAHSRGRHCHADSAGPPERASRKKPAAINVGS